MNKFFLLPAVILIACSPSYDVAQEKPNETEAEVSKLSEQQEEKLETPEQSREQDLIAKVEENRAVDIAVKEESVEIETSIERVPKEEKKQANKQQSQKQESQKQESKKKQGNTETKTKSKKNEKNSEPVAKVKTTKKKTETEKSQSASVEKVATKTDSSKNLEKKEDTQVTEEKKEAKTPLQKYLNKVEEHYVSVNSLEADFVQRVIRAEFPEGVEQSGSLALMQPSFFRWDITFPMEQSYFFNGETLKVWNPMNNQLMISHNNSNHKNMTSIINDLPNLSKLYTVTLVSETKNNFVLHIQTKKTDECGDVTLKFHQRSLDLLHLTSACEETGTVKLSLSNLRRNRITSTARFQFTPPADAEVLSDSTFP